LKSDESAMGDAYATEKVDPKLNPPLKRGG
jgi:hypothetical protein